MNQSLRKGAGNIVFGSKEISTLEFLHFLPTSLFDISITLQLPRVVMALHVFTFDLVKDDSFMPAIYS